VGRDKVFEAMVDPVVILNDKHTIIDVNRAMLDLLGIASVDVIGQSAKKIFADFPIPIKLYTDVSYARTEAKFEVGGKMVFYELSIWPLYDQDGRITGRVYVSHDITAMKELEGDLRGLNQKLEQRVEARTKELAEAYDTTLEGWALALELRDKETEGHSRRVTETTLKVARALFIPEEQLIHIRRGAILHDIGKMSVPDDILRKRGSLTDEERAIIEQHPDTAHQLLEHIPFLGKAMDIPYCHHEKWDGTGYPRGLKRKEIPLAARIFSVVDVWDAIQSERPYKDGWSRESAIQHLKELSGKHFDPDIVDVFLRMIKEGKI
jgi:PAS domain S-box-containing protein/putative nucleotidyltransferase with HDIG domain